MALLRSLLLLALLVASSTAQKRFVYILAGQSNTAFLSLGASNPALQLPNVTYINVVGGVPASPLAAEPMMRIGNALGAFHGAGNKVELFQLAFPGSALDQANQLGFGWWLPEPSLLTVVRAVMTGVPADDVSIIWGQGETDMLGGITTTQYVTLANQLFFEMRSIFPDSVPVQAYLVTPGALDPSCIFVPPTDVNANAVRDAFNGLHLQDGSLVPARIVAHHYDLPHAPVNCSGTMLTDVHLSFAGYVQLGQRIADGITGAVGTYFEVTGSLVVNATTIDLRMTDSATPPSASANTLFSTTIVTGATSVTVLPVAVSAPAAGVLRLTYAAGVNLAAATRILVRHVPGAGVSTQWTTAAVRTASGQPLAPGSITVR